MISGVLCNVHILYLCVATPAIVGELPEGKMLEDADVGLSSKSEVYKYVRMCIRL